MSFVTVACMTLRATEDTRQPLLTAQQVAEQLGMTTGWVYEQTRRGLIPAVPLGRYRRYRVDAIEQWIRDVEQGVVRGSAK